MAKKIQGTHCAKIIYTWKENFTPEQLQGLSIQDNYKLCVIELNQMYREGKESPVTDSEYDYILSLIGDEGFKSKIGTALGEGFSPIISPKDSM